VSQSQWIFIQPNDVWMFRDNKPFSAQENFVARGQFPPNPQVMTGAVRTYVYHRNPHHPIVVGENMDGLTLQGPYMARMNASGKLERFFPAPLDLLHDAENGVFSVLQVSTKADFASNAPLNGWRPLQVPARDKRDFNVKEAEGWLSEAQLTDYLAGKLKTGHLTASSELFQSEERVGLALDSRRKVNRQGLFYRAQFIRTCDDVGLLVGVSYSSALFDEVGMIGLGGEARFGRYQHVNEPESLVKADKGNLKIVLLTPAYFRGGWQPESGNWSEWVGDSAKLVSAALGKPQAISGWDMAKQEPKPLRHFVPTGSVFYFENAEWKNKAFSEDANGGAPYSKMGFGTVAVASW